MAPAHCIIQIITALILTAFSRAYKKENCEFKSSNYSLEWGYETTTKNVVFILKTAYRGDYDDFNGFWTGVGFGNENAGSEIDFVGIFAKKDQVGIIDSHLDRNGVLLPDAEDNIKTINLKVAKEDGIIMVKFARQISIDGRRENEDADLSKCSTFYFPAEAVVVSKKAMQSPVAFNWLKKMEVCNISQNCVIIPSAPKPSSLASKEKSSKPKVTDDGERRNKSEVISQQKPEIAHSVDISGKGDPCSFTGSNYTVTWYFDKTSETVNFVMRHPAKTGNWWSAIGIGDNMSDMDIGVIFLDNGRFQKMVDYHSDSYDVPKTDAHQDWVVDNKNTGRIGKLVELHFSRAMTTPDVEKDKTMDGCVLFQFTANAGRYGEKFQIHKHDDWPDLYKACDLRSKCVREPIVAESIDEAANATEVVKEQKKTTQDNEILSNELQIPKPENSTQNIELKKVNETAISSSNGTNTSVKEESSSNGKDLSAVLPTLNETKIASPTNNSGDMNIHDLLQTLHAKMSNNSSQMNLQNASSTTVSSNNNETNSHKQQLENQTETVSKSSDNNSDNEGRKSNNNTEQVSNSTIADGDEFKNKSSSQLKIEHKNVNDTDNIINDTGNIINDKPGNTTLISESNGTANNSNSASDITTSNNSSVINENAKNNINSSTSDFSSTPLENNKSVNDTPSVLENVNGTQKLTKRVDNSISTGEIVNTSEGFSANTKSEIAIANNSSSQDLNQDQKISVNTSSNTASKSKIEDLNTNQPPFEKQIKTETNSNSVNATTSTNGQQNVLELNAPGNSTDEIHSPTTNETVLPQSPPQKPTNTDTPQPSFTGTVQTQKEILLPVSDGGCDKLKPDLEVCQSYMENYLKLVKEWADRHKEQMEKQYGKACKLLYRVPHVPTLCCQIFTEKCQGHL